MSLTAKQLKHFEERLMAERAYAAAPLAQIAGEEQGEDQRDRSGDVSAYPTHPADLGTDTMDDELAASNATRISGEVAEIDAALVRLRAHPERFGLDEETGEPIALDRLEIIPWARTNTDRSR